MPSVRRPHLSPQYRQADAMQDLLLLLLCCAAIAGPHAAFEREVAASGCHTG